MMRKFLLAVATLGVLSIMPACTSGDSKGEEEVVADDGTAQDLEGLATEGGGSDDMSLDAGLDGEQKSDTTANPDASVAGTTTEDQLTIDSFGGEGTDTTAMTEPVPDANSTQEPAAPEPTAPTTTDVATTTADEIAPPTEVPEQSTQTAMTDLDQPKPATKSLQKVASSPWKMGSKWVNAIYFARPGDSLGSVSQTIYGDDRTSELKRVNPTYNNRDVKPGDKIYYASVIRPEDSEKILTYYEEKNVQPLTYTAKAGDNIRKVSKDLLGYSEAWKEVWASNMVESKQEIPEGTELRYWASAEGGSAPTDMAGGNVAPPQQPEMPPMPDPSMASNELPPPPPSELPPPPDMASNELPPPPPPVDIPPPPPPPMDAAPPPPPPVAGVDDGSGMAGGEQDQTLIMGAAGVAVLGFLALVMVRRKRKQKEMEQALGETHVG